MHRERLMIESIIKNGKHEDMHALENILLELLADLKIKNPQWEHAIKSRLHILAYGDHLTEETSKHFVCMLKNKASGQSGEHWTFEATTALKKSLGYTCNDYDFYAVINKLYVDTAGAVTHDANVYGKLAHQWLAGEHNNILKTYYLM